MTKPCLSHAAAVWLVVLAACEGSRTILPDAPPAAARAIVVAGDFDMTGVLSTLDVTTRTVASNVGPAMAVGGDPILRRIGDELFIVNRFTGNNVTILDATTLAFKEQLGTGDGSNPQDVAVAGNKLYVATLGSRGVTVVTRGSTATAEIDLSLDDPDGEPDCNSIYRVGNKLYVACGLLDNFVPRGPGKVYVVDTATDRLDPALTATLSTMNPISLLEQLPPGMPHAGDLVVPTAEFGATLGGCVERLAVNPGTGAATPAGCLVTNTDLGGFAGRLTFQLAGGLALMWSAVSVDFSTASLRAFDMAGATLWAGSISPAGQQIIDAAACPTGELVVFDKTMNASGLRVYSGTTELTSAVLPIGIGSYSQHGLVCY